MRVEDFRYYAQLCLISGVVFISIGAMGEGLEKSLFLFKSITDLFLELGEVGHHLIVRLNRRFFL